MCLSSQNHLVDICEKMQLQALRIERFISQTLAVKEKAVQVGTVFICLATEKPKFE